VTAATVEFLHRRLQALAPTRLEIVDDSHRHAGHAGAKEGGHYTLTIVAAAFSGQTTIARHRLVHTTVGDLRANGIHALSIRALAPEEV